ncbi:MAG: nitrile hydratase subunit alpha, partial [Desulfobulbia bacterium]
MSLDQPRSMGPHDVGGRPDGTIDTIDHGMTYWEKHANALMMAIAGRGLSTTDERRRYIEGLGDRYYQMSYFERHSEALINALCERGWISDSELRTRTTEIKKRFEDSPKISLPEVPEDSDHSHEHFKEDESGEGLNDYHLMNLAALELLQEKDLVNPEDVTAMIEGFDSEFPNRGAKVVVRAWNNPEFRNQLFKDARPAIEGMGIDLGRQARIIALENTQDIHNVVVCTLCSCYPRFLMGHPPTWYKSRSYRS